MAGSESGLPGEMPVAPSHLGHLVDAAKQQTELIVWMAEKLQEHERRLLGMERGPPASPGPPPATPPRSWRPAAPAAPAPAAGAEPPAAGEASPGAAAAAVAVEAAALGAAAAGTAAAPPPGSPAAQGSAAGGGAAQGAAPEAALIASVEARVELRLEELAQFVQEELGRAAELSRQGMAQLVAELRAAPAAAAAALPEPSASLEPSCEGEPTEQPQTLAPSRAAPPAVLVSAAEQPQLGSAALEVIAPAEQPQLGSAAPRVGPEEASERGEPSPSSVKQGAAPPRGEQEVAGAAGMPEAEAALAEAARPGSPLMALEPSQQLATVRGMAESLQRQMDRLHVDELRDIRLEHVAMHADVAELKEGIRRLEREIQGLLSAAGADGAAARPSVSSGAEEAVSSSGASAREEQQAPAEGGAAGGGGAGAAGGEAGGRVEGGGAWAPQAEGRGAPGGAAGGELEERLGALEEDFQVSRAKLSHSVQQVERAVRDAEESHRREFRAWNLANQVDVIQSVVAEEMRYVRAELRREMAGARNLEDPAAAAVDGAASQGREKATLRDSKELEYKLQRLQECYQQNVLKIAGLKSATRAIEHSASVALDKARSVEDEVGAVAELAERHEIRLAHLARWGSGPVGAEPERPPAASEEPPPEPPSPSHRRGQCPPSPRARTRLPASLGLPAPGAGEAGAAAGSRAASPCSPGGGRVAGVAAPHGAPSAEDQAGITARFVRLGKKVTDLEGETAGQFQGLQAAVTLLGQRLGMMESFLPKRLRQQVEKILEIEPGQEAAEQEQLQEEEDGARKEKDKHSRKHKREDGKKAVDFRSKEKLVETRVFQIDDPDPEDVPWHRVGEIEARWAWCLQPRNEMGRDLAMHFQMIEDERQEFEDEVRRLLEEARRDGGAAPGQQPSPRPAPGRGPAAAPGAAAAEEAAATSAAALEEPEVPSPAPSAASAPGRPRRTGRGGAAGQQPADAMVATGSHAARLDLLARRVDQVLLPQLAELDDRMDRMVSDLRDTKKASEARFEAKADRVLVQGLASRVAVLDVFDPAGLQSRVSSAESSVQLLEQLHDRVALHVRKLESTAMSKSDMTALWQEISGLRVEAQKMQKSVQDVSANSFNVAQKVSIKVENVSKKFEAEVKELRAEKASDKDLGEVSEKVRALEIAVKSSAKALSQSCGPEVNAVVKRIILGMEDKLMLLENRVQALMEGEGVGGDAVAGAAALQGVPAELSKKLWQDVEQATETVQKLKLDVGLSKADLQSVREQLAQHIDIAQRINVLVEKIAPEETEPDTSAMLTLSRVQLMIAAAARQLVAGNKWVTKEAFDYRMSEVRREVQSSSRQLMGQVEEIVAGAGKVGVIDGALSEAASPPAAAARGGLLPKVGDLKRAGPLVGGALRLHCVEELTPRSARGPGRARRAEWQHAAGEAAVLPWPGR